MSFIRLGKSPCRALLPVSRKPKCLSTRRFRGTKATTDLFCQSQWISFRLLDRTQKQCMLNTHTLRLSSPWCGGKAIGHRAVRSDLKLNFSPRLNFTKKRLSNVEATTSPSSSPILPWQTRTGFLREQWGTILTDREGRMGHMVASSFSPLRTTRVSSLGETRPRKSWLSSWAAEATNQGAGSDRALVTGGRQVCMVVIWTLPARYPEGLRDSAVRSKVWNETRWGVPAKNFDRLRKN